MENTISTYESDEATEMSSQYSKMMNEIFSGYWMFQNMNLCVYRASSFSKVTPTEEVVLSEESNEDCLAELGHVDVVSQSSKAIELLMRPLFCCNLIVWGKHYHHDLIKVEKQISDMVTSDTASSIQLRAGMGKWSRDSISLLAKYYNINSQEYYASIQGKMNKRSNSSSHHNYAGASNNENKYISLVKQIDSHIPMVLLSSVTLGPPTNETTECPHELNVIGKVMTNVKKKIYSSDIYIQVNLSSGGLTVLDCLILWKESMHSLSLTHYLQYASIDASAFSQIDHFIDSITIIGVSMLRIKFASLQSAFHVYELMMRKSTAANSDNFLNKFTVIPAFDASDTTISYASQIKIEDSVKCETEENIHVFAPPLLLPIDTCDRELNIKNSHLVELSHVIGQHNEIVEDFKEQESGVSCKVSDDNDDEWHKCSDEYITKMSDKWGRVFQSHSLSSATQPGIEVSATYKPLNLQARLVPGVRNDSVNSFGNTNTGSAAYKHLNLKQRDASVSSTPSTLSAAQHSQVSKSKLKGDNILKTTYNDNKKKVSNMYAVFANDGESGSSSEEEDYPSLKSSNKKKKKSVNNISVKVTSIDRAINPSFWICQQCTFHNENANRKTCEMCDSYKVTS